MPDKKLTDSEIVKALECCAEPVGINCCKCPLEKDCLEVNMCELSLDLINRLQAENERLKENLNIELENYATEYDYKIKAEAIKEFAERVEKLKFPNAHELKGYVIYGEDFDNLLKELVGEKE